MMDSVSLVISVKIRKEQKRSAAVTKIAEESPSVSEEVRDLAYKFLNTEMTLRDFNDEDRSEATDRIRGGMRCRIKGSEDEKTASVDLILQKVVGITDKDNAIIFSLQRTENFELQIAFLYTFPCRDVRTMGKSCLGRTAVPAEAVQRLMLSRFLDPGFCGQVPDSPSPQDRRRYEEVRDAFIRLNTGNQNTIRFIQSRVVNPITKGLLVQLVDHEGSSDPQERTMLQQAILASPLGNQSRNFVNMLNALLEEIAGAAVEPFTIDVDSTTVVVIDELLELYNLELTATRRPQPEANRAAERTSQSQKNGAMDWGDMGAHLSGRMRDMSKK